MATTTPFEVQSETQLNFTDALLLRIGPLMREAREAWQRQNPTRHSEALRAVFQTANACRDWQNAGCEAHLDALRLWIRS